jgi:quercetin dioxygenase-like cupin family protein
VKAIVEVRPWESAKRPTETELLDLMESQGLKPASWSNAPHDVYAAHSHGYDKVIYCVSGSITFGLPATRQQLTLHPGDRLDLPSGTVHEAVVGSQGVICLEAHL